MTSEERVAKIFKDWIYEGTIFRIGLRESMIQAIRDAVAEEREANAQICDYMPNTTGQDCAKAIRVLGEVKE